MSFLGFRVPHETARLFSSIDVPGDKIPCDQMHVTVIYLGDNIPIKEIGKALIATYNVTSKQTPFTMKVTRIKSFPKGPDGYPIIARVNCPELQEFHAAIKKSFKKAGVEFSERWPDYKPHVTLSYSKEDIGSIVIENPIEWAAHEATLWGGDSGDDRVSASFPFVVGPTKEAVQQSVKVIKKLSTVR